MFKHLVEGPVAIGALAERLEGARSHRAELVAELGERLGPRRVEAANRLLHDVVAELGADTAVRGRRVLPPT